MAPEAPVNLVSGEAGWLKAARYVLMLIAASGLVFAEVSTVWKLIALAGLAVVSFLMHHYLNRVLATSRLRLFGGGLVTIIPRCGPAIPARLGKHSWSGSGLCVLPIVRADNDSLLRVIVCRSANHPRDYRRLITMLRLGFEARSDNGILGRS